MPYDYTKVLSYRIIKTEVSIKRALLHQISALGYDITFEQWTVMAVLNNNPGIIQSELAAITAKEKTNITRILDVLQKKGYVERKRAEEDRRSIAIQLSDAGQEAIDVLLPSIERLNESFREGINDADFKVFLRVLDTIGKLEA